MSTPGIAEIVGKRRALWARDRDIEEDRAYTDAAAHWILSDRSLADEIRRRPYLLIECCFTVVDKEKRTVPFFFNDVQREFISALEREGTGRPFFILKGRQQGFTTLITAIQLSYAIVRKNFSGFTLADSGDNTLSIFNDKARMVYARLPEILKPTERFNSARELFFEKLNSSWRIATATKDVGRSRTLNFVHFSEAAFYECGISELQRSIGEAIVHDAVVVYETTANGYGEAKDLWDGGSCVNLFFEWWRSPEYRSDDLSALNTSDRWLRERIAFLREKGLDDRQIAWYCGKYAQYIDKTSIRQEYPCTPEEAFVATGECVFDLDKLNARMAQVSIKKPGRRGDFEYDVVTSPIIDGEGKIAALEKTIVNIRFVERQDGAILLHEEPLKKGEGGEWLEPYAIGGDTAGEGSDYFTAKVVSAIDRRVMATYRKQREDDDLYALQLYCLGKYYHDALIGVEINYSRVPVTVLAEYRYPRIYMREKVDGISKEVLQCYGFQTSPKTRPLILGDLIALMRDRPESERDMQTLLEMTTFVRKENGKKEAANGQHDDLVMARAIANFICSSGQIETRFVRITDERNILRELFHVEESESDAGMTW